ncbi:MAG: hypothetical protein H0T41_00825 [Rhodobacteraceae bacterium]|nr:hypothetical protein [Paracoccaceae bacterium]
MAVLVKRGLVGELEAATTRARTKPRYELPRMENRPSLAVKEQAAVEAVRRGENPDPQAAFRAAKKGWLKKIDGNWTETPVNTTVAFVPNSFVRTASGSSPLARLLNAGEINPLMLAMRLYLRQNLMEARGVPVEDVRQHYHADVSEQLEQHPYRFVTLAQGRTWDVEDGSFDKSAISGRFNLENADFWRALRVLEHSHVVEWAVYTANGKPAGEYATGRPAKPGAVVRNGVIQVPAPESQAGRRAYAIFGAHEGLGADLAESMRHWQRANVLCAIEHASVPHTEGVGILRMTHRADTENTRAWWRQINAESRETGFFYSSVAEAIGVQVADISVTAACTSTAA